MGRFPYPFSSRVSNDGRLDQALAANFAKAATEEYVDALVASSSGGVTDHGALTGLADDDHAQYHNDVRGDVRYYTKSVVDSSLAGKASTTTVSALQTEVDAHEALTTSAHGGIVASTDTRLTNERTPTDGSVTAAKVAAALKPSGGAAAGTESLRALGATASTAAAGNDSRLSDARTPTAHSHPQADITNLTTDLGNKQPLDADLTTIAAIASTGSGTLAADGAGWILKSYTALKTALALVKGDVGLGSVDNTSDAAKPVSTAQQTALDAKAATTDARFPTTSEKAALVGTSGTATSGTNKLVDNADTRLSNARTPSAHAASHASGGTDPLGGNLDAVGRSQVKKAGTLVGTRRGVNFIEGTGITLTMADDAVNEEVDVTIAAAATSGIPATIVDAKGDLIVATAADTVARLAVGTTPSILVADSSTTSGLRYESRAIVTALPASPVDGQECYFQDTAMAVLGAVWHLRYRSGATGLYKWEYIGGGPLHNSVATSQTTASTSYVDLATVGASVALPLAGDYKVDHSAYMSIGGNAAALTTITATGLAAADLNSVSTFFTTATPNMRLGRSVVVTGVSGTIKQQFKVSAGTGTFADRMLVATPIRVG